VRYFRAPILNYLLFRSYLCINGIYHHVQSCRLRSSWVGRYTHPLSYLPILCGSNHILKTHTITNVVWANLKGLRSLVANNRFQRLAFLVSKRGGVCFEGAHFTIPFTIFTIMQTGTPYFATAFVIRGRVSPPSLCKIRFYFLRPLVGTWLFGYASDRLL
jgi:hypothetical protein